MSRRVVVVDVGLDRAGVLAAAFEVFGEPGVTIACFDMAPSEAGRSTAECARDLSQYASLDLDDANMKLTRVPYYRQHESKFQRKRKWR